MDGRGDYGVAPVGGRPPHPSFAEALRVWIKVGLLSFGGPAGQIALMHRELVERRRWISDSRFLHALNYCMLLPGPEAQQLAIYTGWLLHRVWGGIIAGVLFVLPGALLMGIISVVYVLYGSVPAVDAAFYGLKPAVMAIVAAAVLRIGRKALRNGTMWAISAAAFVAIFFFSVPFPLIVLLAAVLGLAGGHWFPGPFGATRPSGGSAFDESPCVVDDSAASLIGRPSLPRAVGTATVWILVWLAPVAACWAIFGRNNVLTTEGLFFSKAALVTFGGAYAVLPYVAQQAVETHDWLTAAQMMDGLALAETTPGPLILVLQFVGFLGGWNAPGALPALLTAMLAAALTSWVTFIPGFLFIFVGGPFIEAGRGSKHWNAALTAVTAAVVGVILNLSVWFAWHVVVPEPGSFQAIPLALSVVFLLLLIRTKLDILWIVALGAAAGLVLRLGGLA